VSISGEACDRSLPFRAHAGSRGWPHESIRYTPVDIEDVFQYVSDLCTRDRLSSPQKSDPRFRLPLTAERARAFREGREKSHITFHLQPDLRALYPASTLAYYLSAPAVMDDGDYIALSSGETVAVPGVPGLETWAGETLRRMFTWTARSGTLRSRAEC